MIIMLFKEINKRDFDKLALKMFSILSSNMEIINSKETISDDDFSIWLKYQNDHFYEKVFIIFEDGDTLAGYFQYSFIGDNLIIEEMEIMPSYQVRFGVLSGLFRLCDIEYRTILQVYPHILARTIRVLAELLKSLACPLIGKMPLQQVFCIREIFSTF